MPKLPADVEEALVRRAWEARQAAYAPYSRFAVGAAVLAESGRIFAGCNVENAVFGATLCAERVAVGQAVVSGERRIVAVAVVADSEEFTTPCGTCRQVLAEFGTAVVLVDNGKGRALFALDELLPRAFSRAQMERRVAGQQVSQGPT